MNTKLLQNSIFSPSQLGISQIYMTFNDMNVKFSNHIKEHLKIVQLHAYINPQREQPHKGNQNGLIKSFQGSQHHLECIYTSFYILEIHTA
jgi:hypothetical protein